MWAVRAALEFGVKLAADHERMILRFHDFQKTGLRPLPAKDESPSKHTKKSPRRKARTIRVRWTGALSTN